MKDPQRKSNGLAGVSPPTDRPGAALLSDGWPFLLPGWRRSVPLAYLLWFFWGLLGAHKLYLGRPVMALAYLLTGGFFMVGWALDLLTLPAQVLECNLRLYLEGQTATPVGAPAPVTGWSARLWRRLRARRGFSRRRKDGEVMTDLLLAAEGRGGALTVTEGVMATGLPFDRVQKVLSQMLAQGYVDVTNHPGSGVVQYVFPELQALPPDPQR